MVSIWSRHLYRAVAILTLNTFIIFVCFELAAMAFLKMNSEYDSKTN